MLNIQSFARKLVVALALAASAGAALAGPTYHVNVNTNAYKNTSGFLDLYLQRDIGAPQSTVTLTNFGGALGGAPADIANDVSGTLPGTVVFGSTDGWNDLYQGVDFGGNFSFDVEFGGDFATTDGTITALFGVGLYDAANQQLGAGDVLQFLLVPQVGGVDGGVTPLPGAGVRASLVPEPSDLGLMVTGLALLGVVRRRRAAR
jgi:hypothetical protein